MWLAGDNLTSVKNRISAISPFIDGWNDRCEPFVWTKPLARTSTVVNHSRSQKTSSHETLASPDA